MRPGFENGAPVPAFLNKLWKMVDDESTDHLISWSPDGKSFIIKNQSEFCAQLVPQFYKHSNMASFVRQLNMYGFHKVSNVENGGLRGDREEIEFVHPCFKRGEPKLVEHIKRKMSTRMSNNQQTDEKCNMEMMSRVLEDVASMRGRQLHLDAQLATMKQHNVALWRELSILRRKHHKQQQIVNKLISFLLTLVNPSRNNLSGLGVKRRFPLMLNDAVNRSGKNRKMSNDSGPTIHELDNADAVLDDSELLDDYIEPFIEIHSPDSANINTVNNSPPVECEELDNVEDCPLSPELLFATSPHLVTPNSNTDSNEKAQKTVGVRVLKTETVEEPVSLNNKRQKTKYTIKNSKGREILKNVTIKPPKKIVKLEKMPPNELDAVGNQRLTLTNSNPSSDNKNSFTNVNSNNLKIIDNQELSEPLPVEFLDPSVLNDTQDKLGHLLSMENPTLSSANDLSKLLDVSIKSENVDTEENSIPNLSANSFGTMSTNATVTTDTVKRQKAGTSRSEPTRPVLTDDKTLATVSTVENNLPKVNNGNVCYSQDLGGHLETMQTELDTLKDLLVGEGYSLDANTLLAMQMQQPESGFLQLFGSEDPLTYTLPMSSTGEQDPLNPPENAPDPLVSGSELMTYNPGFDFNMFETPGNSENSMDLPDSGSLTTPQPTTTSWPNFT